MQMHEPLTTRAPHQRPDLAVLRNLLFADSIWLPESWSSVEITT